MDLMIFVDFFFLFMMHVYIFFRIIFNTTFISTIHWSHICINVQTRKKYKSKAV